jgi:hypothetical protein
MSPAEFDEKARSAKNLSIALSILENYWDKLSKNLTPEQQSILTAELEKLEPKIKNSTGVEQTSMEASKFFQVFDQIEPLSFLSSMNENLERGATLTSPEEELKIKILNYCVNLKAKLKEE